MITSLLAAGFLWLAPTTWQVGSDVEDVARLLLDEPIFSTGDSGVSVDQVFEWVRAHPEHPLADAALSMLEGWTDDPDDAAYLATRLLDLEASAPWGPSAARRLAVLQGRARIVLAPIEAEPADYYPGFLRRFQTFGPEGWKGDVHERMDDPIAYLEPEWWPLGAMQQWTEVERGGWRREVDPIQVLRDDASGQLWLTTVFDVEQGGSAWIEVEMLGAGELVGRDFLGAVPGYALRVDGGETHVATQLEGELPEVLTYPAVLRTGRNRIEIQTSLASGLRPRFALRVLSPDGSLYPGLSDGGSAGTGARDELGEPVAADPPTRPLEASLEYLRSLAVRGPASEALLGVLLSRDGRRAEGLAHVRAAYDRAPDQAWLATHLLLSTLASAHLPDAWRQGRGREIAEKVLAAVPEHHAMGLYLASVLASEDHEEEAIERLERLSDANLRSPQAPYALSKVLDSMHLSVRAEAALEEALLRAPNKVRTLSTLAEQLVSVGRAHEAAETREKAARVSGGVPELLADAAEQWATAGDVERALALLRLASLRDPAIEPRLVALLIQVRRLDEAEARLEAASSREAVDESIWRQRAAIAHLRGDPEGERTALVRSLAIQPSRRSTRERLRELTGEERVRDFLSSQRLDVEEVLAKYSGEGRKDSLVALLDHAVVWVFEDGAVETLTQNVHQARDLAACEQMKEIEAKGETLAIASIDGKTHERLEPVLVDGKYVMPSLEPGDFVEVTYRTLDPAPDDGLVRPGAWSFASLEQTFERSRYVLSMPRTTTAPHPALDLRIEQANLDGIEQETREEGDRIVRVFDAHGRARIVPEPGLPPPPTFLPWVEVGSDDDAHRIGDLFRAEALWNSTPTPEIVAAAERVTSGIDGEAAQARALHDFVNEMLDQRAWSPAAPTQALLLRRGNPTFLYMALLRARGIDAELVWSRGVTPRADEEGKPRFLDANRWRRQPLVLVKPSDGPSAWCEMQATRLLPYGVLFGKVSGANAFATLEQKEIVTPTVALEDGPSFVFEANFHVDAAGAATVDGRIVPIAGVGFLLKEMVKNTPEKELKSRVRSQASQLVRGLTLQNFQFRGLDEAGTPVVLEGDGAVKSFLDREQGGWVARLPIPPLELSAGFAGQGERRLPFRFPGPLVTRATVRIELPANFDLVDPPQSASLSCPGGSFVLDVRAEGERTWVVERRVAIDVFDLPAEEFVSFRTFCNQVDEAERARLHFRSK